MRAAGSINSALFVFLYTVALICYKRPTLIDDRSQWQTVTNTIVNFGFHNTRMLRISRVAEQSCASEDGLVFIIFVLVN